MYSLTFEAWLAILAGIGISFSLFSLVWMRVMRTAWYKRLTDDQRIELMFMVMFAASVMLLVFVLANRRGR